MDSLKFDVVVIGGGLSGVSAAIGASRCGKKVALVERTDTLGGMATLALVSPMQTFHSPSGQVIRGIGQEIVDDLIWIGASPGHLPDPIGFVASLTPFDPLQLDRLLLTKCNDDKVEVFFRHKFAACSISQSGAIEAIAATASSGDTVLLNASAFVDASGNGDLTIAAGVPMEIDPDLQPMSLMFTLRGVNTEEIVAFQKARPEEFHMTADMNIIDGGYVAVSGFFTAVADGRAAGEFTIPRDRLLFFNTTNPDEVLVNTTRVTGMSAMTDEEREAARETGLKQVEELAAFMKNRIPGFQGSTIGEIAREVGVRESRRMIGRYILNENELINSASFDDVIAKGAFPLDIHKQDEALATLELKSKLHYDIPLRCMLNDKVPNLVTIGKSLSVTHEGYSSTRVMPTCMAVGQAGGVAAAHASLDPAGDITLRTKDIQQELLKQNAVLYDEQVKF